MNKQLSLKTTMKMMMIIINNELIKKVNFIKVIV